MLRAAAAELSRSVSTAIVLWAGIPHCPSLVCPEPQRCGDCVCQEGKRLVAPVPGACVGFGTAHLAAALAFGILVGVVLQQWITSRTIVRGKCLEAGAKRIAGGANEELADFRSEARAQAQPVRRLYG